MPATMTANTRALHRVRAAPTKNGFHLPSLQNTGAQYVTNGLVQEAMARLDETVTEGGIMILGGNNGLGKSVAARISCDYVAKQRGVPVLRIEATPPTQTHKITAILANHFGIEIDGTKMWLVAEDVGAALEQADLVLSVEEAGYLSQEALGMLRGWHDLAEARWTLQLVGSDQLIKRLRRHQPELLSRSARRIFVTPMGEAQSVAFARALHPRFAGTDLTLLERAHNRHCHGVHREWAKFLAACLSYSPRSKNGFTDSVINAALAAVK